MSHRPERRDVKAVEWTDHDGTVVRGQVIKRTKTSARVQWHEGGPAERVHFDDPKLRFLTADEA